MQRILFLLLACLLLATRPAPAQYTDPGTGVVLGFSGLTHWTGDRYLVVFDTKSHESERRLGILTLAADAPPHLLALPPVDWRDPRSPASDLEGVCHVPGRTGEFLATESGSFMGRVGRIFRVRISEQSAEVMAHSDLPLLADTSPDEYGDQYEGLECAAIDGARVLVLFGERGGSAEYPTGRVRWATYDLAADTLSWTPEGQHGLPLRAPGPWLRPSHRDVGAFHLDGEGTLWASGTEDGGDFGPFRSVVYAAARIFPGTSNPVRRVEAPRVVWELAGTKVEGLAAPPGFWPFAALLAVSEDEAFGGRIQGLETVLPYR